MTDVTLVYIFTCKIMLFHSDGENVEQLCSASKKKKKKKRLRNALSVDSCIDYNGRDFTRRDSPTCSNQARMVHKMLSRKAAR